MNVTIDTGDDEDDDRLLTLVRSIVAAVAEYENDRPERPRSKARRSTSRLQDDER